jgi:hypothetical protein
MLSATLAASRRAALSSAARYAARTPQALALAPFSAFHSSRALPFSGSSFDDAGGYLRLQETPMNLVRPR